VANGCTRLLTLTCADQTADRATMVRRVAAFGRLLGEGRPQLAFAWVLERHQSGALHAHLALSEYVHYRTLRRLWVHGIVDVRKIRAGGGRESARQAGRYLAKYVSKSPVASEHQHRYDVRQGFQPVAVRVAGFDAREVWRELVAGMGGELPAYTWESGTATDWTGPPVTFLGW
jgi:hypothetical protein